MVTVFGADVWDQRVGIWMELIAGRTLEQLVRDQGPCSVVEATEIGVSICGALSAVHREGLLHRDLKTQNVMRETGGRIVLMDLGASAELLEMTPADRGSLAGTPLYMAPELLSGVAPSIQSDVYSLGVLLFRLVTAAFPIEGANLAEVKKAHEAGQMRLLADARPGLPSGFQRIVERALDALPSRRFESAGAMQRDLMAFLQEHHTGGAVTSPPAATAAARWRSRPALWWRQGSLLVVAGIVTGVISTWLLVGRQVDSRASPGAAEVGRNLTPRMNSGGSLCGACPRASPRDACITRCRR